MSRWLAEGRTLGLSLRRFHAVVVAGGDADATADVALGIAESQAKERRVVLGDLSANVARFGPLIADDDPHGLVDAFDYGISLGRVARPVASIPNLQFAPTGYMVPDYAELLSHPRWAKLYSALKESDNLMVIVLPISAPAIEELVHQLDGMVLVNALAPARVESKQVIANIVAKARTTQSVPAPAPEPEPAPPRPPARRPAPPPDVRQTGVFAAFAKPAGYGAGLSILAALVVFWLLNLPFGDREPRSSIPGPLPGVLRTQASAPPRPPDPNQANPADSGAAVYAVRMMSANTHAAAILKSQEFRASMPAVTYAPVPKSGETWFEVLTGAFITRGGADSLLTSLRSAGHLDSLSPGVVVRVPYAVRIDSVRKAATISDLLESLRMRQLPVYALEQDNGWVWVVAGAFETRALADSYAETIRTSGLTADVVLRQGRVF